MVKSDDKVGGGAILRTVSVLAGAVALAFGMAACGGGGGGGSSSTGSTSGTSTATGSATITTPTASGSASVTGSIELALVVNNSSGAEVANATVVVTKADGTTLTFTHANGAYTGSLAAADIASTSTVVVTVSADTYKTTPVNFKASDLVAGNRYSATVTLDKTGSLSLGSVTLTPSSVYLGDGVPLDKKTTNQFSTSSPIGLTYTADLGAMTSSMEGYANLVISAQVRGVDGLTCPGDVVTVFQSTSASGTRVNASSAVRISTTDATTADPVNYEIKVPATAFKASAGNLYAEFSVQGQKCSGGTEYDDLEIAGVNASFAAN